MRKTQKIVKIKKKMIALQGHLPNRVNLVNNKILKIKLIILIHHNKTIKINKIIKINRKNLIMIIIVIKTKVIKVMILQVELKRNRKL